MEHNQKEKWKKVKEALEKSGKTDSHFYLRACQVLSTGVDPFKKKFKNEK